MTWFVCLLAVGLEIVALILESKNKKTKLPILPILIVFGACPVTTDYVFVNKLMRE